MIAINAAADGIVPLAARARGRGCPARDPRRRRARPRPAGGRRDRRVARAPRTGSARGTPAPARHSLPAPRQRLVVAAPRIQPHPPVVRRTRPRPVHARRGGAVLLDVLGELEGHGRAPPALLVVPLIGRVAEDLQGVQEIALPRELAVPGARPGRVVDPQLHLAVEVVLVLRHALKDPELPLRDRGGHRSPRHALPVLHHVADRAVVVDGYRPPAAAGQLPLLHLARAAVRGDEARGLLVADGLPLE